MQPSLSSEIIIGISWIFFRNRLIIQILESHKHRFGDPKPHPILDPQMLKMSVCGSSDVLIIDASEFLK